MVTYDFENPCSSNRQSLITVFTNTICVYWGNDFTNKWVICQRFSLVSSVHNGCMRFKNRSKFNFCCLILNIYQSYYNWKVPQNLNSFYIYYFITSHVSQLLCCSYLSKWHNHSSFPEVLESNLISPFSSWISITQPLLSPFMLPVWSEPLISLCLASCGHLLMYLLPTCLPAHNIASAQQPEFYFKYFDQIKSCPSSKLLLQCLPITFHWKSEILPMVSKAP